MDVFQWTDQVALNLPFPVTRLVDDKAWKVWARNLIQYPQISVLMPPDPEYFIDWRPWAVRFNQVVELQ
jgi:hypothetical protein